MSKSLLFGVYDKVAQKYIGLEVSDSEALCKRSFYNRVRMAPQSLWLPILMIFHLCFLESLTIPLVV